MPVKKIVTAAIIVSAKNRLKNTLTLAKCEGFFVKIKLPSKKLTTFTSYILVMGKSYEKEFLRFYDQHADGIFRFCLFRVYDREQAKDLTQETFLKTWEYLSNGKVVENIKSLAYRIALNLIIDRSRKKNPESSLEQLQENGFEPETKKDLVKEVGLQIELKKIFSALNELEPIYREAATLRYVHELGPKEISQILNESESVVSVRISRGTKQLRQLLKKYEF